MSNVGKIAEEVAMIGPRIGRRIMADIFQITDIPPAQLFVIMHVSHNGPVRTSDLVTELMVAAPTVTGIVDRLEAAGYVRRAGDKADRRTVMVELTPEGQKLALKLRATVVERWTKILAGIPSVDAEKYLEILKKISEAL